MFALDCRGVATTLDDPAPQNRTHPVYNRHSVTPEERHATLERVCARIEQGELTARAAEAEGVTDRSIRRWVTEDESIRVRYTRARDLSADALAEQAVGIATGDGEYEDAQARRLAYDALRWLAGKRRPKEYGDKQQVEVSGGIEHLHLDALRSISAKARIANDLGAVTSPKLLGAQPIDTEQEP